jgi:quercetin dioxygenase-like cupin family protein
MHTETKKAKQVEVETTIPKSTSHIILEIVEYVPHSIARKTIIKKLDSSLTAVSFDEGEIFCEKTTEHDTYVQVIDGSAEVTIGKKEFKLKLGESMVIPENTLYCFIANEPFKMIVTIIKSSS